MQLQKTETSVADLILSDYRLRGGMVFLEPDQFTRATDMKHINWDAIPAERLNDKFVRKLAWDGQIMVGQTLVGKGYVVPLHSHDNQQVTFVTSGKWRFQLEGKTIDVGPNEMIFIPANTMHTAEAVETLVAYDIFTPPREDWISGSDSYLRA